MILSDLGISDSSQNLSSSPSYADDMFHVHRRYDGRGRYQVEHALTASLPTPSGPGQAQPSSHWPSHVFSGTLGACITVLLGGRGAQPQV